MPECWHVMLKMMYRRQPLLELSSLLNVSCNTTWSYLHEIALHQKNCILVRSINKIDLNLAMLVKVGVLKIDAMCFGQMSHHLKLIKT